MARLLFRLASRLPEKEVYVAQIGKLSFAALMLCAGASAGAEEAFWLQSYKLAGEIIVTPQRGSGSSSSGSAAENQERARSYKSDGASAPGTKVILLPEEENGLLAPRGGDSLPVNRARAKEYQKGPDSQSQPQILILPGRDPAKVETPHERIESNRSKARTYMKGETPAETVGIDGLPIGGIKSGGATSRDKARAYQADRAPSPGITVIVAPNEDDGLLSPRGGGESLPANRAKAREYQSGPDSHGPSQILITPGRDSNTPETSRERLEDNRSKARSYMKGGTPIGLMGKDELPVVNCRDVDSVAGRIGDDTQSGSVISIFQNGKQIKVRCR